MKIGIFDSGIGGLSVLHQAMKKIPQAQFLYYADEKHVPYGEKNEDEIKEFVEEILNFLIGEGVDAIVIACNTATSVATKEFRNRFPVPIVGMEPAVKKAVEQYQDTGKRILVTATPVTVAGEKLHALLERVDKNDRADLVPLPELVRFAEKGEFQSKEIDEYLNKALSEFELEQYAAVVLGCTHFNYFKEKFCKIFPGNIHFVDGNEGTVRQLIRVLPEKGQEKHQKVEYYFSGKLVNKEEKQRVENYMKQLDAMYEIQ